MNLTININDITQPVLRQTRKRSLVERFIIKTFNYFLNRRLRKLDRILSDAILKTEGSYTYLKKTDSEKAREMLIELTDSINDLVKVSDYLHKSDHFKNDEIKSNFKYLLKCMYKAESILHKVAYKDKETLKTDKSIKDGIIKMNSAFIQKSVG